MKRQIFTYLLLFLTVWTHAQVSADVEFPTDNSPIVLKYNAAEGNKGLMGFTGDVYAHIGVLTDKSTSSSNWQYTLTAWGVNSPKTKLTRITADTYELSITPSIREFFGVPVGEKIQSVAVVFRSSDATKQGKTATGGDLFLTVYEPSLSLKIISPLTSSVFVNPAENIHIEAKTAFANSAKVFVDGLEKFQTTDASFTYDLASEATGSHIVKLIAYGPNATEEIKSFQYTVRSAAEVMALPGGVRDGINYISATEAVLVLHAPFKKSVYAIGEFNNWLPGTTATMHPTSDPLSNSKDLRWWIRLTGLESGKEYAFQYLVDESLKIADPYTEKILNSSDDEWIPTETYPDLKPYPKDFTTGNVSILQTSQAAFAWTDASFQAPKREDLVIYELHLRDFTIGPNNKNGTPAEGNLKRAIDQLDYLKDLGITAIELMPVNEFEGNNSWGYNPAFMFAADKAYGTRDDLKKFIDECHKRGMAVITDLVMNHAFGQSPFVQLYFDKEANNQIQSKAESPWFNIQSPNESYFWGADFNHESVYTQALLDRINEYWLTNYHLDGFRFDFTKGFTNKAGDGWAKDDSRIVILKRMYDKVKTIKPNAYIILEHFAENSEETILANYGLMLWGNISGNYGQASMGFTDNNNSDLTWAYHGNRGWSAANLVSFMESHDEERIMFKNLNAGKISAGYSVRQLATALKRAEIAAAFLLTIPGPKMIWQFGELGYDFSIDFNGRVGTKPVKWSYLDDIARKHLHDVYASIAKLKVTEPAFETPTVAMNTKTALKSIVLTASDMSVVVIGNFDVSEANITVNFPQTGNWYDFETGLTKAIATQSQSIALQPGEYHIYTTKKLKEPDLPTSIEHAFNLDIQLYPNPVVDKLQITNTEQIAEVRLFDITGRLWQQVSNPNAAEKLEIDTRAIPSGILVVQIRNKQGQSLNLKLIK